MKWVLIVLGMLVILLAVAALVGAMTPQDHHATRKARYRATPEALYVVIAGAPDWRTGVKSYGHIADGKWWEEDTHGQKVAYELVEDSPPARRVIRIADKGLPFGGTWTFEIAPAAGGSDLRIREDGEIYNVIFRFMARFFFGYTSTIETYLRDLGAKFGQAVEIEG
ncbi:MAG TPA: hypothetical protein VGF59_04215 [Bryobacteraceae bacterium]|jgi:hypothetical protein